MVADNRAAAGPALVALTAVDLADVGEELVAYHAHFAPLFARREQREWAAVSLRGLLVATTLGEEYGVLILDSSDVPKRGDRSVGVAAQWCGATGKTANCQAGVFLGYASRQGYTLLDGRPSVPQPWFTDADHTCQTKAALAVALVEGWHQRGVLPAKWLVCEAWCGRHQAFLDRVAVVGLRYRAAVPRNTHAWPLREPADDRRARAPAPRQPFVGLHYGRSINARSVKVLHRRANCSGQPLPINYTIRLVLEGATMITTFKRTLNVLVAGGSGHWSETNHYPALLSLRREGIACRVVAICDPVNPYTAPADHFALGRQHLYTILAEDCPKWLDPLEKTEQELSHAMLLIHNASPFDIIIIASNPTTHFFYACWATNHGISILCDKPPVLIPYSSFRTDCAQNISQQYLHLTRLVQAEQNRSPTFTFYTLLRRRLLREFSTIADGLSSMHKQTGQGVTHMTVILNNGLHRFPLEFSQSGAHGYIDGVGSLAHSAYHYLDMIAWYLRSAQGEIARIGLSVPYVYRVGDYLRAKKSFQLSRFIRNDEHLEELDEELPPAVLNSELDFIVYLSLYDQEQNRLGLVVFANNHTTFTSRLAKLNPQVPDPANQKLGGRMKQLFVDIHQGLAQNYVLTKNGLHSEDTNVVRRVHPSLGTGYQEFNFSRDHYESDMTPIDLIKSFVRRSMGLTISEAHDSHLNVWMTEKLTHELFAACYEKIAEQYAGQDLHSEKLLELGSLYS